MNVCVCLRGKGVWLSGKECVAKRVNWHIALVAFG